MNLNPEREYIIEAGTEVHIGAYIRRGWEVFKAYPGGFLGFTLTVLAIELFLAVIPVLGMFALTAVGAPLGIGYFIVFAKIVKEQPIQFSDFFKGFNYWGQLVLASLVSSFIVMFGTLLLIIPGIYLAVSYQFMYMLVVDHKLEFWEAMEASRKIITGLWFQFFLFLLALGGLALLGTLALGIGLLVAIPVIYCTSAAAYEDIVGIQSEAF